MEMILQIFLIKMILYNYIQYKKDKLEKILKKNIL